MLIFLKPVQGRSPPPATASGTTVTPIICEQPAPPGEQRVKRWVWLAVGGLLAASVTAGIYMYVRRPRVPLPTAITAGHASRPATTNRSLIGAATTSGVVCGQVLTSSSPQVSAVPAAVPAVVWPKVEVTAIIGHAQGHYFARVNHRLVTVGDTIRGMTVVGISAQSVKFAQGGAEREFPVGGGGE